MAIGIKQRRTKRSIGAKTSTAIDDIMGNKQINLAYAFSNQAYAPINERHGFDGYEYVDDLSSKRQAVFYNKDLNQSFLAQRGTKPTDLQDLYQDAQILTGLFGENSIRPSEGSKTINDITNRYKDVQITNTGHSLGGSTANVLGKQFNMNTIAFNQGSGITQPFQKLECYGDNPPSYCDKIKNYRIQGDPISFLSRYNRDTHTISRPDISGLTKHSLSSFEVP